MLTTLLALRKEMITELRRFESHIMPFGLSNAPAVYQVLVNNVQFMTTWIVVFVCLDDLLIFSSKLSEHEPQIHQVLQCLLENKLYVNGENCKFRVTVYFHCCERADQSWPCRLSSCFGLTHSTTCKHLLGFDTGLPQTCSFCCPLQIPFCPRNSSALSGPCLLSSCDASGHCLQLWATVYIMSLEGVLLYSRCPGKPLFWFSPTD